MVTKFIQTHILTISTQNHLSTIKKDFHSRSIKVYMHVPNLLHCFRCQQYGQHKTKCKNNAIRAKCFQEGPDHSSKTYNDTFLCFNCKSSPFHHIPKTDWSGRMRDIQIPWNCIFMKLEGRTAERIRSSCTKQAIGWNMLLVLIAVSQKVNV